MVRAPMMEPAATKVWRQTRLACIRKNRVETIPLYLTLVFRPATSLRPAHVVSCRLHCTAFLPVDRLHSSRCRYQQVHCAGTGN